MIRLKDISGFPDGLRRALEAGFGVTTAEAFYEHSVRNPAGIQSALSVSASELAELVRIVTTCLSPDFVESCKRPVERHGRGVVVDDKAGDEEP